MKGLWKGWEGGNGASSGFTDVDDAPMNGGFESGPLVYVGESGGELGRGFDKINQTSLS